MAAAGKRQIAYRRRRIAHAHFFQHVEHGSMDAGDVVLAEGLVLPAGNTAGDSPAGSGLAALYPARFAAAATPSCLGNRHFVPSEITRARLRQMIWRRKHLGGSSFAPVSRAHLSATSKNRFPFAAILLRLLNDDANQKRQSFRQRGQSAG